MDCPDSGQLKHVARGVSIPVRSGTVVGAISPDREMVSDERKESTVGISLSLLLAAAGAILIWAVNTTSSGFNIHTAGVILLVVGIIGFVSSLVFWSSWGGFGGYARRDTEGGNNTTVVR